MNQIQVRESIPGLGAARNIMACLERVDIRDIQLFYDNQIRMWAVVQVAFTTSHLIMPESYNQTKQEPYLLWWCKDNQAKFREPNDEDLRNIITVVKRAPEIWAKGTRRADDFELKDAEKDRKHNENLHDKIHTIAPAMKKALKERRL